MWGPLGGCFFPLRFSATGFAAGHYFVQHCLRVQRVSLLKRDKTMTNDKRQTMTILCKRATMELEVVLFCVRKSAHRPLASLTYIFLSSPHLVGNFLCRNLLKPL
ncbi:MAG: hypothetical protein DWH80_12725 [Planctomycetota bacterium]|nr:MAG: hypothetical protein DWH80_12725 [Planctomycetota bacterium]